MITGLDFYQIKHSISIQKSTLTNHDILEDHEHNLYILEKCSIVIVK